MAILSNRMSRLLNLLVGPLALAVIILTLYFWVINPLLFILASAVVGFIFSIILIQSVSQ